MSAKCIVVAAMFVAACGGASPGAQGPSAHAQKGGGAKGVAAKDSGQRVGGHAVNDRTKGQDRGATYDELTCADELEGLAWCDSATELAFCSGGEWWVLDCSHPEIDGDFCGEVGTTVDCYATAEF
jgi:hypothetical protein